MVSWVVGTVGSGRSDRFTQDVFGSLSAREESLIGKLTLRTMALAPNRLLVSEGEVGIGLYRVTSGWAYRYSAGAAGCRQILDFLLPGELVGLQAALIGEIGHSVRSLTPLCVNVIDPRLVGDAFRGEPDLALRLARYAAAEAVRVEALLSIVGCRDALERLAFLMVSLYRRQSRHDDVDPLDVPFPLRRQHLADALGLTGAHVNRTMNRLRDDGIAALENRRLAIRNLPALEALAGSPAA